MRLLINLLNLISVLQFVQHDDRFAGLGVDLLPESAKIFTHRWSSYKEVVFVSVSLQPNHKTHVSFNAHQNCLCFNGVLMHAIAVPAKRSSFDHAIISSATIRGTTTFSLFDDV